MILRSTLLVIFLAGVLSLQIAAADQLQSDVITHEMAAGLAAKLACSGVFLQRRNPEEVVERDLRPIAYPLLKDVAIGFDQRLETATANSAGVIRAAMFRPGVGCTLMLDGVTPESLKDQARGIVEFSAPYRDAEWPEGDVVSLAREFENVDWEKLDAAVDAAFVDTSEHKTHDTRAILVVYRGEIIAEKYADGFGRESRFLGWSASKSVTSALIGTMVTDNMLALDEAPAVPEWISDDDVRKQITLRNLLDMTSGLEFAEPYDPGSDSTNMLFRERYMAQYAASKAAESPPDTRWYYSSGTTNILSRILMDRAGGTLEDVHSYAWNNFFEPVGMTSAVFESDASGAHVGSSYFYATARDWARFGLLFLNKGRVGEKQVLSKEWVAYSRSITPLAPQGKYGAQFWKNSGHPERDEGRIMPDAPRDLFLANGYAGQHIAIVPSKNAVVIRLGWTNREADFDLNKHFSAILDVLPDFQQSAQEGAR